MNGAREFGGLDGRAVGCAEAHLSDDETVAKMGHRVVAGMGHKIGCGYGVGCGGLEDGWEQGGVGANLLVVEGLRRWHRLMSR